MSDSEWIPAPEKPVLVIGAASVDLVGRLRDDLHEGTSNPANIRSAFGGVARNVAENLARLGHAVRLLSVVGADSTGDAILQQAASAGIDVDAVLRSSEHPTGAYLAVVDADGKLRFALDDMRALAQLSPEYIRQQEALFEQSSLLFVDANLPKDTLRTVMSLARRAHLPVCADPTSRVLAERLRPYLKRLLMITPNSAEAAVLCGLSLSEKPRQALQAARCLVSQGVQIALVTLAEFGVSYATSSTSGHIPAMRTQIVDPTGAGDALTAVVIFALLNDIPIDDAVRLGVTAASLTLRQRSTVVPDLSLEMLYDQLV